MVFSVNGSFAGVKPMKFLRVCQNFFFDAAPVIPSGYLGT
jgi:hypothetical protein